MGEASPRIDSPPCGSAGVPGQATCVGEVALSLCPNTNPSDESHKGGSSARVNAVSVS